MRYLGLAIAFIAILGCTDVQPTEEDRLRQAQLEQQFGDQYDFALEDVYLVAIRKSGEPTKDDAVEISKVFWSEPSGRLRTNTSMAYLNLHGPTGFRFQAYYDRMSGVLKFGTTEHY